MKLKLMLICFILLLSATQIVFSQTGLDFNFIGAGARARGMGGAFIGVADDATAASWNPAGLVYLESPEASVVYVHSSVYESIDDEEVEDLGLNHGYLNFVSAAVPISAGDYNIVGCIAYQRIVDFYNESETSIFDNADNEYFYDIKTKGGVDAISPSIGIQLNPEISLGVALNIYTGKTTVAWKSQELLIDEIDAPEETYSGTNLSFGGLFDFGKFRLGAVYKTPFTLLAERKKDLGDYINFWSYERESKLPAMLGIGVMFEPTSNFKIAADYEMRKFSEYKEKLTFTSVELRDRSNDEFVSLNYEDLNQLRLGMEYLLMSGSTVIPLRFGVKTEPKPGTDSNGDQFVGSAITMGVGLVTKMFSLSATLEYSSLTVEYDTGWDTTEIVNSQLNFILSGIIYFGQ